MNQLQRIIIEKLGNENGFEHVIASDSSGVKLASARHANQVLVGMGSSIYQVRFQTSSSSLLPELRRNFATTQVADTFLAATDAELATLLRRAASLSRALPSQAARDFQCAVDAELAQLPAGIVGTEVERMVRQRVGQNKFRDAMMDYWCGACAVTGVSIPEVLRASHTKPWAECSTDTERLDVFNGFLLSANLDALFDRFLISFDDQGVLIIAPALTGIDLHPLGILPEMKLRWVDALHKPYLALHRSRLLNAKSKNESNVKNEYKPQVKL